MVRHGFTTLNVKDRSVKEINAPKVLKQIIDTQDSNIIIL